MMLKSFLFFNKSKKFKNLFIFVAGAGFEPATFGLWARRAATALPRDNKIVYVLIKAEKMFLSNIN